MLTQYADPLCKKWSNPSLIFSLFHAEHVALDPLANMAGIIKCLEIFYQQINVLQVAGDKAIRMTLTGGNIALGPVMNSYTGSDR